MSKRQFRGRDDREHYLREIQSVACLSEHVNVVKYYRSWQQDSHFYIQMELCEGGNLRSLIDSYEDLMPESKVRIGRCLVTCVLELCFEKLVPF